MGNRHKPERYKQPEPYNITTMKVIQNALNITGAVISAHAVFTLMPESIRRREVA